jgi:two-component sensor histidine kinase/sensor domain CHASE-containing protein
MQGEARIAMEASVFAAIRKRISFPLSLRKKTLLLVAVSRIALIVLVYAICRIIILDSFAELETTDTREHVLRVQSVLEDEFADLGAVAGDWAPWTDTYDFVQGYNVSYIEENLMDATFANLRLNMMVFLNDAGEIVYAKGYNIHIEAEEAIPPGVYEQLSVDNPLLQYSQLDRATSGLLLLPGTPVLVASRPIVTSDSQGPIGGTLIVGRYLDADHIADLSHKTRLFIHIDRADNPELSTDFRQALTALTDNAPIFIQPIDSQTIPGYFLLNDITGAPGLIVRVDDFRSIYQRGQDTLGYLVVSVTVAAVLIGVVILLILEKYVLARLSELTESVWKVGRSGDRSARVALPQGEDELWQLASTINEMLESLQHSETQLHQSKVLLKEVHHRIKNNLQVINSLLTLQTLAIHDERINQLLKDCQHRIESIALVHEKLYSSTELSLVDVGEYTKSLVDKLRDSMVISNSIRVSVNADPIILDVDRAVPIGLILSELITNALKYAFPDGKAGEISVSLQMIEDNQYSIIVRDDGVGFPEDLDIRHAKGLGLQLVIGLTEQLDGTVELRRDGGAVFEIRFASILPSSEERR